MTYDNIKSHKRPGFHFLFKRYIFQKTTGKGCQNVPLPAVLWLRHCCAQPILAANADAIACQMEEYKNSGLVVILNCLVGHI